MLTNNVVFLSYCHCSVGLPFTVQSEVVWFWVIVPVVTSPHPRLRISLPVSRGVDNKQVRSRAEVSYQLVEYIGNGSGVAAASPS